MHCAGLGNSGALPTSSTCPELLRFIQELWNCLAWGDDGSCWRLYYNLSSSECGLIVSIVWILRLMNKMIDLGWVMLRMGGTLRKFFSNLGNICLILHCMLELLNYWMSFWSEWYKRMIYRKNLFGKFSFSNLKQLWSSNSKFSVSTLLSKNLSKFYKIHLALSNYNKLYILRIIKKPH